MSTNIGAAELDVIPSTRGFGRQLERQLDGEMRRAGTNAGRTFSGGLARGARKIGGLGAALGLGKVIKDSVGLEASFTKTMAQVQAATDAPASALKGLSGLAIKLGADTSFSANEASGAMLELAKAGISTSDIMGGTLQGTLLLAAAGGTDLATASTIASNAMNTFNLKGKDMASIAAALAGGANASSASVESLGQALSQVGPGAKNAGLSLQQTVGVLSAFDAAGIKGSDAGTSLKTMLTRLVPQTDKARSAMAKLGLDFTNADGSFQSITQVAGQLRDKMGDLSEEQRTTALTTLFGSDATRAASVLIDEGAKGISKYIRATKDQAAAQKLAKANMSGTAGALERLSGAVETAELQIGQALAPSVNKLANFLSKEGVPAITGFVKGMQDGTGAGGDVRDVIEDVVGVGKGFVKFFNKIPGPVKKTAVQLAIAGFATQKLVTAIAAVKATSFVTSMAGIRTASQQTGSVVGGLRTQMSGLRSGAALAAGAGGMLLLAKSTNEASDGMKVLEATAGGALTGFAVSGGNPIGALVGGGVGGLAALNALMFESGESARKAVPHWQDYATSLDETTGASTRLTRQMLLQDLQNNHVLESTRAMGISDRLAVNGIAAAGGARDKLIRKLGDQKAAADTLFRQEKANAMETARGGNQLRQLISLAAEKRDATKADADAILRRIGVVEKDRRATLANNVVLAKGKKATEAAKQALDVYDKTHALAEVGVTGFGKTMADIAKIDRAANALARTRVMQFNALFGVGAPSGNKKPKGNKNKTTPKPSSSSTTTVPRSTTAVPQISVTRASAEAAPIAGFAGTAIITLDDMDFGAYIEAKVEDGIARASR